MEKLAFKIHGMDCAEEVAILNLEVGPVVGGQSNLAFDILNAKMVVLSMPPGVSASNVEAAVGRTGMKAKPWKEVNQAAPEKSRFQERWGRSALTGLSGLFLILGFFCHAILQGDIKAALGTEGLISGGSVPISAICLYLISTLTGAWPILPKAWLAAKRLRPDMNLLMTLAVMGAMIINEWFEAATVAFLFAVSLALESWSVGRARSAVAKLLDLVPPIARLKGASGIDTEVTLESVVVGDIFKVKPGERIPLDGRIVQGSSSINQAPITGESLPAQKEIGDDVFAGTINGDGSLEIESSKPSGETTLSHIIRMVAEAQTRRGKSEQWVETFARIYTPVVLAVAVAVVLIPPLFLGGAWQEWMYRALVLLVIGCPCALVISTPVSIVAALAASAHQGVLVKGGIAMETVGRIKALALDKTGTLTEGKLKVTQVVPMDGHSEPEVLTLAASLDINSDHPLARAIVAHANGKVELSPVEEFRIIQGKGAFGKIHGKNYWIGSHRYLEESGLEVPEIHRRLELLSNQGHSVVALGTDRKLLGFLVLADTVRPEAGRILGELRSLGIRSIIMLTGDNSGTAYAISKSLGIDEVHAELLPEDKVKAMETLATKFGLVAMVGDGVNDAPALARATLGIAMGAAGSDAAIETADIALMSDDLSKLPWVIRHSRKTMAIIRQNIAFSLGVKAIFVALTFLGTASLWAAIAADMGASLLVIFNALRLLKTAKSKALAR
jgi:Cd2+/Zn2+-exporting ATPase